MKKNLFLTLALLLASLVGVNAQDWSMTLGTDQGLPGYSAMKPTAKGSVKLKTFKSSVIRPGKAIDGFRFTVLTKEYDEKANGHQFFYLGEFAIYNTAGEKLDYEVTSNACHNTLTGGTDGGGLAALKDGNYDTYFHSVWNGDVAPDADHYLEFTLTAPVEEFIVEWTARNGKQYMPTLVGLTEKGQDFVPYSELDWELGDKIETLQALKSATYVTIQGNADTLYTVYNNEKPGEIATEKVGDQDVPMIDKKGPGKLYFAGNSQKSATADASYTAQLIPTGDADGSVYVYFPKVKRYLNGRLDDENNQFNNAQNGWQNTTGLLEKAAKVILTPVGEGDFTMHYIAEKDGANYVIYIGAEPRGNFKIFSQARKEALETKGWCEGFGIKCYFNFSFFDTKYTDSTWDGEFKLGYNYNYAKALYEIYGNVVDAEGEDGEYNVTALETFESEMQTAWETVVANEGLEYADYAEQTNSLRAALGRYIEAIGNTTYKAVQKQMAAYPLSATPKNGYYSKSVYDEFIGKNVISAGESLYLRGYDEEPIDYINEWFTYLNSIQTNVDKFLASQYVLYTLKDIIMFGEITDTKALKGTALGTNVNGQYVWEQNIILTSAVDGFRMTFLANNDGQNTDGYPMIALAELQITDANGQQLALDSTLVTTNSVQVGGDDGGGIKAMLDGENSTYYHSYWGNGTKPTELVYLDVQFPEETSLSEFKLKYITRNGGTSPACFALGEYGVKVDPKMTAANPFNVKVGAQVTDASQIVDGGIYIISGNLRVNKEENPSTPRYYSGVAPYHTNVVAAANDPCVYMFKKAGDGWNIVSLAEGQYWAPNANGDYATLTTVQQEAAVIKVSKSNNIPNAFAFYSDIEPITVTAGYALKSSDGVTDSIAVPEAEITLTKRVYMDWDGGLAHRPCQSELPGVFEYGYDVLQAYPELINESAFGDYVHFNKASGEGEWNIYAVTMDTPYYRWLQSLAEKVDELAIVPGIDPGCVVADAAVEAAFNGAKAAAEAAVAAEEKDNAETLVNDLVAAVNSVTGLEVVEIDSEKYYRIESGEPRFFQNSGVTRSIYVDEEKAQLMWGHTPESINVDTENYIFRLRFMDDFLQAEMDITVTGADADYSYIIWNETTDTYVGGLNDAGRIGVVPQNQAVVHVIKPLKANQFGIWNKGVSGYHHMIHANQHGGGTGNGSDMLYWDTDANNASAWCFRVVEDYELSISDLVVKGDEVVSVSYFTPAGAATTSPVKGINIMVVVYSNGVVETKKVLVK